MIKTGEEIKVLLPGERPWVKVLECVGDRFKGRIINTLFHELCEHHQAQFTKRELGSVSKLPQLHDFKAGDEVWFEMATGDRSGWWIPIANPDYGDMDEY